MGTRADFFLQVGDTLTQDSWLGSIAWDGYPEGISAGILEAQTSEDFLMALARFRKPRRDWTSPRQGWPWPWANSTGTDYAYVFTPDGLAIYDFGRPVDRSSKDVKEWRSVGDKVNIFPDMTSIQDVTFGERSGLTVISVPKETTNGGR